MTFQEKLKLARMQGQKIIRHAFEKDDSPDEMTLDPTANYFTLLSRTFDLMNHANSKMMAAAYPPDILVNMPFDAFGAISDYGRAKEICEAGRALMHDALDRYEQATAVNG